MAAHDVRDVVFVEACRPHSDQELAACRLRRRPIGKPEMRQVPGFGKAQRFHSSILMTMKTLPLFAAALFLFPGRPQAEAPQKDYDVVSLQADASREVDNDQAIAVLAAEARGDNPAALAEQVNKKMAVALKLAKAVPAVRPRSGSYRTTPTYKSGR